MCSNWGRNSNSGNRHYRSSGHCSFDDGGWFFLDHGIESVDVVSGAVDGSADTIGINHGVAALDIATTPGLLLALGVSGQVVLDSVGEAALRMRVVFAVSDHDLSRCGNSPDDTSMSEGDQSAENDELKVEKMSLLVQRY